MNSFKRYITGDEEEDLMEVDHNFTERYLSRFSSIDRQTIDVLIENGYQNKECLLAFDIKEDLPLLPDLNMAQKSLLRKALMELNETQEFESKVEDIKGVDSEEPFGYNSSPSVANKRKTSLERYSPAKKSRLSSVANTSAPIGQNIRQLITGRKSIRNQLNSDSEFETEVNHKNFDFRTNVRRSRLNETYDESEDEVDDEEVAEVQSRPLRGRPARGSTTPKSLPIGRGNRSPLNDSQLIGSLRKRLSTPRGPTSLSIEIKSESKAHVPTPTELEVRERLALKAKSNQKSGRKRKI